MRIFNKFRAQSLEKDNLKKYFKYAIGEIVLVVIGILIAFQINAYGDRLKQEIKVNNILEIIKENLKQDTAEISLILEDYNEKRPMLKGLLSNSVTEQEVDSSDVVGAILFSFSPFNMEDMGYLLLKKQESVAVGEKEQNLQDIADFYSEHSEHLKSMNKAIKDEAELNIRYYVNNYEWFHKVFTQNKKEFVTHVMHSPMFKNRLLVHDLIVESNYLPALMRYKNGATEILSKLEEVND